MPLRISRSYDVSKHWPTTLSAISSSLNTTARSEVAAGMRLSERTGKAVLIPLSWELIGFVWLKNALDVQLRMSVD